MRAGGGVGMEEGGIGPFNMAEAGKGAGERRREERGEPREREEGDERRKRGGRLTHGPYCHVSYTSTKLGTKPSGDQI